MDNELNDELRDNFIESYNNKSFLYNTKTAICIGLLSCTSIIIGLIYFNIKCGSFSDNIDLCDIPDYCPNKDLCNDGSDLI